MATYKIVDKQSGEVIEGCKKLTAVEVTEKIAYLPADSFTIEENGKKKVASNVIKKHEFDKSWITRIGLPIVRSYGSSLTLRSLHYKLVAAGMTNDVNHYKKVINAMTDARWEGLVAFNAFVDNDRETLGTTDYATTNPESSADYAKERIKSWATYYSKNRWENQPIYPEVFIEKKALQGVFENICSEWDIALSPCKGYPSLTFQWEIKRRFENAIKEGKEPVILYFGDYDCSGEDIPRSIKDTLFRMGVDVEVKRIALMEEQVIEWNLPPAPTKSTDTRSANWDGLGQVELDAVDNSKIQSLLKEAIQGVFDQDLHDELLEQQDEEEIEFKEILKRDFNTLLD